MEMINKHTRGIIISVLILVGIGTLMVYSSTALMSMRKYGGGFHYLWNHLFTVVVGLLAMSVLFKIDYLRLRPFVYALLAVSLISLLLVFIPGIGGYRKWRKEMAEVMAHNVSAFGTCENSNGYISC